MYKKFFKKISKTTIALVVLLNLTGCVALGIGAVAGTSAKVATDPRTTGVQIDDEVIEEKISFNLNKDEQLNSESRIDVIVYNKIALLTGQVSDENSKEIAKNIAKGVEGVKEVYNELKVTPKIGYTQILQDNWITSQVKSKLLISSQVKATDIKVTTENGEVFLMGMVAGEQAEAASKIASEVPNVKRVVKAFEYLTSDSFYDNQIINQTPVQNQDFSIKAY